MQVGTEQPKGDCIGEEHARTIAVGSPWKSPYHARVSGLRDGPKGPVDSH
jgi:hypothetical protein